MSARAFYFVMFALFYVAVVKYPNKLRDVALPSELWYLLEYIVSHALSIYLFLTAGRNPGFVDETETPNSRREKAKLFVGQYDEFKGVHDNETTGGDMPIPTKSYEVLDQSADNPHGEIRVTESTQSFRDAPAPIVTSIEQIAKIELPKKRFCEYCSQEQPYRSKHCKECERCVRKYDHHCFWVGGCVGELNHRKFWLFLFFQTYHFLLCFGIVSSQPITIGRS